MTAKKFKQYLEQLIVHDGLFVVDTIDMEDLYKNKVGDEIMLVAGEDQTQTFTLDILKIK
jgi:hypothetical protein